jgi:dipeptidyl-peptidase-4
VQQYLALERQYVGFHVDVRGSVGYGRAFREKLLADVGAIDVEDLASGVEYLKTLPYVDPERIGIWGSSYGGLMTLLSLFKKPGVYRAGVAGAPVSDFRHVTPGVAALVRRPETHPQAHRQGSAIHFGDDLRVPLMILHGMQDSIVLFKDSVVLSEKLMRLGKDFEFVVIPNATHYWSRRDYAAVYALRQLVSHFKRHLGRGPR